MDLAWTMVVANAADMLESLDAIHADISRRLVQGATDRRSAMHTPVVATADADVRVMVLRGFDAGSWTLRFHTDARSPKVAMIEQDPRIGVLAYDREAKIQLRLRGKGQILRNGRLVDEAWEESTNFARRCYLGSGPGEPSENPTSGLPNAYEGTEPPDEALLPARENFALLMVEVGEADWFSLAHSGHRRALFVDGKGRWISP